MSRRDEFNKQWKTLTSVIESEMIRRLKERDTVSPEEMDAVVRREVEKWSNPSLYQGIWLENMKQANPSLAEQFRLELGKIGFRSSFQIQYPSFVPGLIAVVASGAAGFIVSRFFAGEFWKTAGLIVLPMILTGIVAFGLWQDGKNKRKKQWIQTMMTELTPYRERLEQICAKLDSMGSL